MDQYLNNMLSIRKQALQEDFPLVPCRYIDAQFKEKGNFYGAHVTIAKSQREYDTLGYESYVYLGGHNGSVSMKEEVEAARQRRKRDDGECSLSCQWFSYALLCRCLKRSPCLVSTPSWISKEMVSSCT